MLFEGAQGTLLDLDHGTYPFVTSSNPVAANAATGVGIGPNRIDRVIGVAKAYVTRVGEGPFPTEIEGPEQARVRELGGEFGTVTGRERRCGWLDLVALRYAVRLNGITSLALTKLDVLSAFAEMPVCVRYRLRDGTETFEFPAHQRDFHHCRPVYETLAGWEEPITATACPTAARALRRVRRARARRRDLARRHRRRAGARRRAPLETQLVEQAALALARCGARYQFETVRLVQPLCCLHPLARVETDGTHVVFARPVERDPEQLLAETAPAPVGTQVHPLQLDCAVAEVAERNRPDHSVVIDGDPEGGVCAGRIVEVRVEHRVLLEAELTQCLGDQRTEAFGVRGLERNDRYGAVSSSTMNSKTER